MTDRCTWDCSNLRVTGSTLFWLRLPHDFSGDFPSRTDRLCQFAYCTHTDHPCRDNLPSCAEAKEGAAVEWGAACSLSGQEVLF